MAKKSEEEEILYKEYKRYIRSKEWKDICKVVLERDGYRCRCCGRTADETTLCVHHSTYDHLYDERNHLEDLITLDSGCHLAIHRWRPNWQRFKIRKKTGGDEDK